MNHDYINKDLVIINKRVKALQECKVCGLKKLEFSTGGIASCYDVYYENEDYKYYLSSDKPETNCNAVIMNRVLK